MQETRVVLALKLFPTKRRGGVVPSCMFLIQLMQETNLVLRLILQNLMEESYSCLIMHYVSNTPVCNEDRRRRARGQCYH